MIDRQYGRVVIACDSCDATFEGETDDEFAVVWAEAKRDGWRTRKIVDEWLHGCPRCGVPS